jgi:hypothetical protein
MTKEEIVSRLGLIKGLLNEARELLEPTKPYLEYQCDLNAARAIGADLTWAMENITVISLHQNGQAMNDNMGHGDFSRVKSQKGQLRL